MGKKQFAPINRNFLNYPLARDPRVITEWEQSDRTGRWWCELTGDPRIKFYLPTDFDELRGPDAFDMNLLFTLLREARVLKTGKLEFNSQAALLKLIGLTGCAIDNNRHRLRRSLDLWLNLRIYHGHWYDPQPLRGTGGMRKISKEKLEAHRNRVQHIEKLLPPPIRSLTINGTIHMVIARDWRIISKEYFQRVPLPLPVHAAAQNLVLGLLTGATSSYYAEDEQRVQPKRSVRGLCNKIGLTHTTRGHVLENAIRIAEAWFARYRGQDLIVVQRNGRITFSLSEKRVEQPKQQAAPRSFDRSYDEDGNVYDADGKIVEGV